MYALQYGGVLVQKKYRLKLCGALNSGSAERAPHEVRTLVNNNIYFTARLQYMPLWFAGFTFIE